MTKEEKINLLEDNTRTDREIASILKASIGYIAILRTRWRLKKKKRGKKKGTFGNSIIISCFICRTLFRNAVSNIDRKYCSRDCMHKCEEYRKKLSLMNKDYMKTEAYSKSKSKEDTPEYTRYVNKVHRLTQKIYEQNKEHINPMNLPRGLAGIEGVYHLDHIVPIRYGFDNGISPDTLADKTNLQMLDWKQNISKGKKIVGAEKT